MIPAVCPQDPPGEEEVFRRLRDDPDTEGWTILHSLDLARHSKRISGEADFVIIVPGLGILVLEVKSHRSVHYNEKGWHLGHDPVDVRGPFKQASEAMHSIRGHLGDADASFGKMVAWSAVCFPYVEFSIPSVEWHDWQVIDKGGIRREPISRIVRRILERGKEWMIGRGISCASKTEVHSSVERCKAASQSLRPLFEISVSPKVKRKERDRGLLSLTQEQFQALDQVALNPRVVFSGPAGSGKTVLAAESLRRACISGDYKSPAMFCFNRKLAESLAAAADTDERSSATIMHIDAWLRSVAGGRVTKEDSQRPDFFDGVLAERAIDGIIEDGDAPLFDLLILDEAQDLLEPYYLDVLDLALEGGLAGGNLMMFGDFVGQDIYCKSEGSIDEFVAQRCPSAARFQLMNNCRNTPGIAEYIVTLGKLDPAYRSILRPDDHNDPELFFWRNPEEQVKQIKSFVETCIKDGFSYGEIVLLSPSGKNPIGRELALDPDIGDKVVMDGNSRGKISYTTIQSFKGLEAPVIAVTDFDLMDSKAQQSLFYIGLSRALHRLGVFLHSDLKKFVRSAI